MKAILCLALFLSTQVAVAQGERDPTLAPLSSSSASTAAVSPANARAAKTLALVNRPLTLIERDGRRYVVLEGHLYAEGQNFGTIHLERVRETEVWFRDGTALYKMSRFPGIERRAVADVAAVAAMPAMPAASNVAPPAEVGLPYSLLPR